MKCTQTVTPKVDTSTRVQINSPHARAHENCVQVFVGQGCCAGDWHLNSLPKRWFVLDEGYEGVAGLREPKLAHEIKVHEREKQ